VRKLTTVALIIVLLLLVAVTSAVAAKVTDRDILETAKGLIEKNPQQAKQMLAGIIARAKKNTPEVGGAYYLKGRMENDDDVAIGHLRKAYSISSEIRGNAGNYLAYRIWKKGDRMGAAAQWKDVGAKFPEKAMSSFLSAANCYAGAASANVAMRTPWRAEAMRLYKIVANSNTEGASFARLQILGLRCENAMNLKESREAVNADLDDYVADTTNSADNRVRAAFMVIEFFLSPPKGTAKQPEEAMERLDKVISIAKDPVNVAWALTLKGECLKALGKNEEAIAVYDGIISQFGDADPATYNMRGNDALANAFFYKADCLRKLGKEDEAAKAEATLLLKCPNSIFAKEVQKG